MDASQVLLLARENIRNLTPYSTARDEYRGDLGILLDANESPYGQDGLNRYPSRSLRDSLIGKIAGIKGVARDMVFLGNGSDETIDLCYRVFCEPGADNAVMIAPSYGMYSVCAGINDAECREVLLNEDYSLPVEALLANCDARTKLMFICSPNNPTGNSFPERDIRRVLDSFKGILVLDEAYIDFSRNGSKIHLLEEYSNLIILQTLSKAYGMAGLRVGMALADPAVVALFDKVRYPYNIGTDTLRLAMGMISQGKVNAQIERITSQRDIVSAISQSFNCVEKVYPSDANFLLVKVKDPDGLYSHLLRDGIIVRNRSRVPGCEGCLRLTIGTPEENERMLRSIETFDDPGLAVPSFSMEKGRWACRERVTCETKILVEVDLDGAGQTSVSTGLKFFDHMLEQIPHHSGISLKIKAEGDLEVDEHHTMEDVAITLGETLLEALGDRRGIERYGFALPMDECDAIVTLDLGGRIDFKWEVDFTREYVGDTPTEMFKHFFQSLCSALKCNLHITAKGENNHHLAESIFKAFARALRQAVRRNVFDFTFPSSKGTL
ncbi:MAG: histidinol-phosphate transaminase [Bacteroidales bacterium]|nr:histidinol-phosphate transaminase [Bacteroidales bacterium]